MTRRSREEREIQAAPPATKLAGMKVVGGTRMYVTGVLKGLLIFGLGGTGFYAVVATVRPADQNVASRVCDRFPSGSSFDSAIAYARDTVQRPERLEVRSDGLRVVGHDVDPRERPICEIVATRGEVRDARYFRHARDR